MITFIIVAVIVLIISLIVAIPLAGVIVFTQAQAKKQAKKMLASGEVTNWKKFDRICSMLATTSDDLEATDLWHKLQDLKEKLSKKVEG